MCSPALRLSLTLLLLLPNWFDTASATSCGLAELSCKAGHCVPVDAYCNGIDDCGDGSDEPALCTPCNRTYHGREGRTYRLDLPRPAAGRLPFLCHVTFTAGGQGHGELVQLLWDAFSIGRLDAEAEDVAASCPEGSMQLVELGRPFTGGSWCGPGEGRATYYSETSTVTASIRLFAAPSSVPFEFRLRYRFVSRLEAIARLGSPEAPIDRGSPVPGTYCSRNFYECYQRTCRVQSPNYPGEYPRNASCLLTLRQKEVPTCKHAMMSVKSAGSGIVTGTGSGLANSMLLVGSSSGISSSNNNNGSRHHQQALTVWQECPDNRDRLIIRDGSRPEDPVLLVYCGGQLPRITARGPAMLLEFRSSAQAVALGASALRLELETQVVYVDSDGLDYAQTPTGCFFIINGTARRSGPLRAPLHALPPGTNCTWNVKGVVGDRIWIYFASYWQRDLRGGAGSDTTTSSTSGNYSALPLMDSSRHQQQHQHQQHQYYHHYSTDDDNNNHNYDSFREPPDFAVPCTVKLTLWDGATATGQPLAVLCDETPKLCAHAALRNSTRVTRPCGPDESYLTVAPSLTVRMETVMGTALNTVSFNARYEFISTLQGGEQWGEPNLTCSRIWRRVKAGGVTSPRDLRLFGRGGAKRLDCRYRIEAAAGERVKLTVHNVSLGDATACNVETDPHSARPRCVTEPGSREARLAVFEAPWKDVRLPRACLCDNTSALLPLVHVTSGRAVEIVFYVDAMTPDEDFDSLYFNASFELVRAPECTRKQRVRGEGGELRFVSPPFSRPDIYCDGLPWLVEARDNRSLFLLTWGWLLPLESNAASGPTGVDVAVGADSSSTPSKCPTTNRLLLYSGWPLRLRKVICPAEPEVREYTVHVFSEEWLGEDSHNGFPGPVRSPAMLLDFVAREQGQAAVSWLEISKSRQARRSQLLFEAENGSLTRDCPYKCPELQACISSSLWCDGHVHCPSGHDEADCGSGARLLGMLPSAMWIVILGCIGAVSLFGCLMATIVNRSKARAKRLQSSGSEQWPKKPRRAPTEETLLGSGS